MKILHNNIEILNIQVDDSSYRYRAIKGDHNLTLYFSLAEHVEIPVGAYCVYEIAEGQFRIRTCGKRGKGLPCYEWEDGI